MFQWGNFKFEKELVADGYTKLLCHFNYLQGWPSWDLDARDSSFFGLSAAIMGAVSANPSYPGFLNGCAYFPTGNIADYITYTDNGSLQISSNLTVEGFISPSKLSGTRVIVDKHYSYRLYFVDGAVNVTLGFFVYIGGSAKTLTVTVPESSFYGIWHHIKATYDGQYQRIYLDGVEKGSRAQIGAIDTSIEPLFVGRNYASTFYPYKGFIDELRISNMVRPFIGQQIGGGKTALSGTKVQKFSGGQSALKRSLTSQQEGQSRLRKQIPLIRDGKTLLAHHHANEASGQSALGKVFSALSTGHAKLAYFVFEADLSHLGMGSFKLLRSPLGEMVNKGLFLYQKDYRAQSFAGTFPQEDLESQGRYGIREKSFALKFVREAAMAAEVANYYFNSLKEIRARIIFRTFLCGLHLEVGDHILVNYPLYNLTGELFTVTNIKFIPGSGQKRQLDQVEIEASEG